MDDVKERVIKLEVIQERITDNQESLTQSMREISKSMQKQELLFEKLISLETAITDKFKVVHKRIDMNETTINDKVDEANIKECKQKIDILEPVIFFVTHPKLLITILASSYLLTIKEIRDVVIELFKVVS